MTHHDVIKLLSIFFLGYFLFSYLLTRWLPRCWLLQGGGLGNPYLVMRSRLEWVSWKKYKQRDYLTSFGKKLIIFHYVSIVGFVISLMLLYMGV